MVRVQVAVPLPVHGSFTYTAEKPLEEGVPVMVPFGARSINGWVVGPGDTNPDLKLKAIERVDGVISARRVRAWQEK